MPELDLTAVELASNACTFYSDITGEFVPWDYDSLTSMADQCDEVINGAVLVLNAAPQMVDEIKRLRAKWHREECARCDERVGGYQGTMYCEECFKWYQQEYAKDAVAELRAEVETLRAELAGAKADTERLATLSRVDELERLASWARSYALASDIANGDWRDGLARIASNRAAELRKSARPRELAPKEGA